MPQPLPASSSSNKPLFGQATTTNSGQSPATQQSIFSSVSNSKPEPSSSTPSMSGNPSGNMAGLFSMKSNSSGPFQFSELSATAPKNETQSSTSATKSFGGSQASNAPLFGGLSAGTVTPSKTFSFSSTTPAGPPPNEIPQGNKGSLFNSAAKSTGGSIFSGNSAEQTTSLFGKGNSSLLTTTNSSTPASTSAPSQPSKLTFSIPTNTNSTTQSTQPSETPALSGNLNTPTSSAQNSSTLSAKSGLFSVPGTNQTSSNTNSSAPSISASSLVPPFSFPNNVGSKPLAATTTATTATPSTQSSTNLSQPATSQPDKTKTDAVTAPTTLSENATSFGSSTMGPSPQLSRLKNKTMDEIITRWASDLSKYQKEFQEQASKVAAWDRLMVENGEKIQKLYFSTYEAERQNVEIERQLLNVESQQDEVASWLDKYESDIDEMFSRQVGQGDMLQGPDQEREKIYKLAEKLTDRLDEMGKNLTSMIDAINDASTTLSKNGKADDTLSSIVRVLNNHLTTLQWIDENADELKAKVEEAQKIGKSMGSVSYGVPESESADSFFRSLIGRK